MAQANIITNPKISVLNSVIDIIKSRLNGTSMYLDVGCGDGSLTIYVAKRLGAQRVYCIDIDDNALSIAKNRGIATLKLDVSSEHFPFADNTFDVITALDVIEHVLNPDNMLKEIFRILKKEVIS